MNLLSGDAVALASALNSALTDASAVEVIVCPVFTVLAAVSQALKGGRVAVGGQNCYHDASGAFTGEISPQMLHDAGCTWTIVGHSERRQLFGEADALLNRKLKFALASGLNVMFCVGETLDERKGGMMETVLRQQVSEGLSGLTEAEFANTVIAYEPVWAIGTGVTATPEQAQDAHAFVRGLVRGQFGATVSDGLRIQYGGSVKPDNAADLLSRPDVDGALVGGASLNAEGFAAIVRAGVSAATR